MVITKEQFEKCIGNMGCYIPFEQTKAWNEFKTTDGVEFIYFVDNIEFPLQACFGRVYHKRIIGRIIDIAGEVRKEEVSRRMVTKFFKSIIEEAQAEMITYNGIATYRAEDEIGIRCAGFVRPLGNRVCPLTQFIPVQGERNGDRNWKRNLRKAKEAGLSFEIVNSPTQQDAAVFVRLFDELIQRKHLGFSIAEDKILPLLQQPGYKLCYARLGDKVLCARIIYLHRGQSADVFAANSFDSMKYSATHFIMESIFEWLKAQGVQTFDFSRIPPSANETNSIYQFKDAAGGYPVQYLGEWIWTKKDSTRLLFALYNYFTRKHSY